MLVLNKTEKNVTICAVAFSIVFSLTMFSLSLSQPQTQTVSYPLYVEVYEPNPNYTLFQPKYVPITGEIRVYTFFTFEDKQPYENYTLSQYRETPRMKWHSYSDSSGFHEGYMSVGKLYEVNFETNSTVYVFLTSDKQEYYDQCWMVILSKEALDGEGNNLYFNSTKALKADWVNHELLLPNQPIIMYPRAQVKEGAWD